VSRSLRLTTFGNLRIQLPDVSTTDLLPQKAKAILVYVARTGQTQSRDFLAEMFWTDQTQERANGNLRMALMKLRELGNDTIEITRNTVEVNNVWMDANVFEDLWRSIRRTVNPEKQVLSTQIDQLEQMVALYSGNFLSDFYVSDSQQFESWQLHQQEGLRTQYVQAAQLLVNFCLDTRDYPKGIRIAQQLLLADSLREETYRLLMKLFALSGDRNTALKQFELCKHTVRDELGVEPEAETKVLYDRIVTGELVTIPYSITIPAPPPNNLPASMTTFIGREQVTAEILEAFNATRLLTLVGPGGVGKTRLSLQVASKLLQRYRDGVFFVELAPLHHPEQVAETVARVLGIKESGHSKLVDNLEIYLQKKQILLILDNFEHLPEAGLLVDKLLRAAPELQVLVTSREPLDLYGEYLYLVPVLSQDEAFKLFTQSATPGISVEANTTVIQEICQRLEGLPLALELAAAQVRKMELPEILAGLDTCLQLLQSQFRNLPERQRTMRGTIEWSYQLLTSEEQELYRQLSVFVNSFTLEAVEAVCGQLITHLPSLIEKSLLHLVSEHTARYSMLETIRQHAAEKLAEGGEQHDVQAAHITYYASFAEAIEFGTRSAEQAVWLTRMEDERDNVRAALLLYSSASPNIEAMARIIGALALRWYRSGYFQEMLPILEFILSRQDQLSSQLRAHILAGAGHLMFAMGDYIQAQAYHLQALNLYKLLDDTHGQAFMLFCLAVHQNDVFECINMTRQSLNLARAMGDDALVGDIICNLGVYLCHSGQAEEAISVLQDGLAIVRKIGIRVVEPCYLNNLAGAYRDTGESELALKYFEEGVTVGIEMKDYSTTAISLTEIADLQFCMGNYQSAAQRYEQAIECAKRVDSLVYTLIAQRGQAMIAWQSGDTSLCCKLYQKALSDWQLRELIDIYLLAVGIEHIVYALCSKKYFEEAGKLIGGLDQFYSTSQIAPSYIHRFFRHEATQFLYQEELDSTSFIKDLQSQPMTVEALFAYALTTLDCL
jgi:predicted ATPase